MDGMMWTLMNSIELAWALKIAMLIMIAGLVAYAFSREGRDERGRANIGTACIWGLVVLFIASNVYSLFTTTILENSPIAHRHWEARRVKARFVVDAGIAGNLQAPRMTSSAALFHARGVGKARAA